MRGIGQEFDDGFHGFRVAGGGGESGNAELFELFPVFFGVRFFGVEGEVHGSIIPEFSSPRLNFFRLIDRIGSLFKSDVMIEADFDGECPDSAPATPAREMADLMESDREHWVSMLEHVRDSGRFSLEIEHGRFHLTLGVAQSGAMIVVQDSYGDEVVVRFDEVYLDSSESESTPEDDLEGALAVARLRSAMVADNLCSVVDGPRSVQLLESGDLRIVLPSSEEVRITPDFQIIPRGVNLGEVYAAVERLRVAAVAYRFSAHPDPLRAA